MSGQTKKKSGQGAKRSSSAKNKKTTAAEPIQESVYQEVILWVMLAVSIVLFVSNFGIGGKVGSLLSGVLFGLFGLLAYIFPILLFVGTVFILSNKRNKIALIKVVAAVLFVCFLCLFLELVAGSADQYSPAAAYAYGNKQRNGGGFFGGLLAWLICPNFGRVSAYVIDFIVLIITMVIVTERSAWIHVKHGGQRMYESAKEGNEKLRIIQEQHREERQLRRMERKVSGVSADTLLTQDNHTYGGSEALTEITPETFASLSEKRKKAGLPAESASPLKRDAKTDEPAIADTASADGFSVVGQRQVSLQPVEDAAEIPAQEEPAQTTGMPVFSPELQELFARIEPEEADGPAAGVAENTDVTDAVVETVMEEVRETEVVPTVTQHISTVLPETIPPMAPQPSPEPVAPEPEPVKPEPVTPRPEPAKPEPATPASEPAHSAKPVRNAKQDAQTAEAEVMNIAQEIEEQSVEEHRSYTFPPVDLLKKGDPRQQGDSKQHLQQTALKLQQTLKNFGVNVTILNVSCGPTVTRYEIQPEMGVKVSKIVNLTDDIKLNLAAADIRMEAPIPGKAAIGIEVPNKETLPVMFRDLVESREFKDHPSNIAFAAGRDIGGQVIMADIAKMPHLLIAGATGSGKSVCINTIIMSLLYRADPEEVKLILIDPKVVELSVYNGIPHLFIPVVTDPKKAAGALNWAVAEMTERYQKFATYGVRDLKGYNAKVESISDIDDPDKPKKLPQIVIIVDELADLMMVAPGDVEDAICRLAQLARACGIHLIIATQRPSVNVITGLIKANMPSRIAFSVTSGVDSRTILDMVGAEKLLGKGDCLYYPQGLNKPLRVQGAFVSDQEVSAVVDFIKDSYGHASYDQSIEERMSKISESAGSTGSSSAAAPGADAGGRDVYFVDAAKLLMDKDKASIGMLQRYFKVGFNRAARIMDQLEEAGVVGPEEGTKPRQILMNPETFDAMLEDGSF